MSSAITSVWANPNSKREGCCESSLRIAQFDTVAGVKLEFQRRHAYIGRANEFEHLLRRGLEDILWQTGKRLEAFCMGKK